jgi:PII-like signaling protein
MQGACLKVYMTEVQKHDGKLLYEWVLERAKNMGVPGGSVFRAIAGYGRHGKLHEETFFELAADLPVELEFVASDQQIDQLLELVEHERLRLFYVKYPVTSGVIGDA